MIDEYIQSGFHPPYSSVKCAGSLPSRKNGNSRQKGVSIGFFSLPHHVVGALDFSLCQACSIAVFSGATAHICKSIRIVLYG